MVAQPLFQRRKAMGGLAPARLRFWFARRALARTSVMSLALLASLNTGYSEVLVNGSRDDLVVEADQAALSEVIGALGNKFDVRLKSQISLDHRVSGRFSGPLTSVLRRLFEPYNFIFAIRQNGDTNSIVVIVLGQANNADLSRATNQPIIPPKVRRDDGGG